MKNFLEQPGFQNLEKQSKTKNQTQPQDKGRIFSINDREGKHCFI